MLLRPCSALLTTRFLFAHLPTRRLSQQLPTTTTTTTPESNPITTRTQVKKIEPPRRDYEVKARFPKHSTQEGEEERKAPRRDYKVRALFPKHSNRFTQRRGNWNPDLLLDTGNTRLVARLVENRNVEEIGKFIANMEKFSKLSHQNMESLIFAFHDSKRENNTGKGTTTTDDDIDKRVIENSLERVNNEVQSFSISTCRVFTRFLTDTWVSEKSNDVEKVRHCLGLIFEQCTKLCELGGTMELVSILVSQRRVKLGKPNHDLIVALLGELRKRDLNTITTGFLSGASLVAANYLKDEVARDFLNRVVIEVGDRSLSSLPDATLGHLAFCILRMERNEGSNKMLERIMREGVQRKWKMFSLENISYIAYGYSLVQKADPNAFSSLKAVLMETDLSHATAPVLAHIARAFFYIGDEEMGNRITVTREALYGVNDAFSNRVFFEKGASKQSPKSNNNPVKNVKKKRSKKKSTGGAVADAAVQPTAVTVEQSSLLNKV